MPPRFSCINCTAVRTASYYSPIKHFKIEANYDRISVVMKMKYSYSEKDREIIKIARKTNKDKQVERRLKALELQASGKKAKEISAITGFHPAYISQLMAKYRDGGIEAITGNHYGGNRRNMSVEEEAELLEPFRQRASQGQLIEISEIKAAYEKAVGHTIGGSQIYYVLRRHGWRKVMPRSKHPKRASDEVIEASKKLTLRSSD